MPTIRMTSNEWQWRKLSKLSSGGSFVIDDDLLLLLAGLAVSGRVWPLSCPSLFPVAVLILVTLEYTGRLLGDW